MGCRVLKNNGYKTTFAYKGASHKGIDIVGPGSTLDYIVAHSDGTVVGVVSNCNRNTSKTGERIYGNYVKIKHDNGMYTLYAHMKYGSVTVKNGDRISRGQVIGYMGNTGYSFGAHLHFEVRDKNNNYIDPTGYVDADLPSNEQVSEQVQTSLLHNVGEIVTINGVYTSSNSDNKLVPAMKTGTITRIVNGTKNPYLLNNGNIGWVNDNCIVTASIVTMKTISNCSMLNLRTSAEYGNNIYKVVNDGTQVEYLGMENGWAKIRYDGRILYCGSKYLK